MELKFRIIKYAVFSSHDSYPEQLRSLTMIVITMEITESTNRNSQQDENI